MRHGVSPILAAAVMTLVVVGMATSAILYLQNAQRDVVGGIDRPSLETVNITCDPETVTWWITNTADHPVQQPRADLFISQDHLNTTASRTSIPVNAQFTGAHGTGSTTISITPPLRIGQQYDLELAFPTAAVTTSCRIGSAWWDVSWPERRAVKLDTTSSATANVSLNTATLTATGRLRQDCADIRAINNGAPTFYDVTRCAAGVAWIRINVSQATPGRLYVYYGNLNAGFANTSVTDPVTHTPVLGLRENVSLPG